jgi:RNA polymerase sigma factor (sigma-70 family)
MSKLTQAEQYLLEQIRRGSQEGWSQLVDRYQGRLMAFARAKVGQRADCEDVVQETFIGFIKGLNRYRGDSGLETYLFSILRRKIVDSFRRAHFKNICLIQDVYKQARQPHSSDAAPDERTEGLDEIAAPDHTASWYARRDEQHDLQLKALAEALSSLINGFKKTLNFQDLEIVELLFYCRLSNRDAAKIMNLTEGRIAVVKHRCIKHVHERIASLRISFDSAPDDLEAMLKHIWQSYRLSCPKRSTIGAYMLETLDDNWHEYVRFHLYRLGCSFCLANLEDLRQKGREKDSQDIYARIMESTVGFLQKPQSG